MTIIYSYDEIIFNEIEIAVGACSVTVIVIWNELN